MLLVFRRSCPGRRRERLSLSHRPAEQLDISHLANRHEGLPVTRNNSGTLLPYLLDSIIIGDG